MKKTILGLFVLAVVLTSCGGAKTEAVSTDSTAVKTDSTLVDSTKEVKADTATLVK